MNKIPFLDLETTGLVVNPGAILEVSVAIVDTKGQVLETYSSAVHHDMQVLDPKLTPWAADHHMKSGLLSECVTGGKPLEEIEAELVTLLDKHFGTDKPVLAGNSIHFDRSFIKEYMPLLDKRLHYRMIDVSGLWEWAKLVKGATRPDNGKVAHRGLPDVMGSLKLMQQFEDFVNGQTRTPQTT